MFVNPAMMLKFKYKNITADAGYESEENYLFLDANGQFSYIKPANYEISKTRKYRNDIGKLENMGKRSKDTILPVQIAYFTGLRLGKATGLTWQDINLEEQYLTVRRRVRYNGATHKHEIGATITLLSNGAQPKNVQELLGHSHSRPRHKRSKV